LANTKLYKQLLNSNLHVTYLTVASRLGISAGIRE